MILPIVYVENMELAKKKGNYLKNIAIILGRNKWNSVTCHTYAYRKKKAGMSSTCVPHEIDTAGLKST
jgi:hypothetical protein